MNAPAQPRTLSDVAQKPLSAMSDITVNMFSAQGFALAQRIATAFASSDAVPAQFRSHVEKRNGDGTTVWVENSAAIGNCLVAIEVAQAVGMSVTAVMQNADVIEGKLRWSGKFVIAAINASRRFTPLRFDIENLGVITAAYKEKGTWNKELRRYNMIEKSVEVENLKCVAWAIPAGIAMPPRIYTLAQAREAGLPVIESAPVSIKLAVEEGWYSKPGSKWQTELKHLMLQYRAGTFFGNIHAPDIVMGMGRTTEEAIDTIEAVEQPDGSLAVDVEALRATTTSPAARRAETQATDVQSKDVPPNQAESASTSSDTPAGANSSAAPDSKSPLSESQIAEQLNAATTIDALDSAVQLIADVPDPDAEVRLTTIAQQVRAKLERGSRRTRGAGPSVE